ncbi:hypothetical protein [Anaerobacillus alkaliphilus]|nr:hypothetical protein [Anaerobacillus alkaliphilus]
MKKVTKAHGNALSPRRNQNNYSQYAICTMENSTDAKEITTFVE